MLIKGLSRKTAFGIDISDRSIEAVWLGGTLSRPKFISANHKELPGNLIESGKILDPEGLASELQQMLKTAESTAITSKSAIISIPSQAIISDLVILDTAIPDADIENEIYQYFMLHHKVKRTDYTFNYYEVETDNREKRVFFVAASKTETLQGYISVLKGLGIKTLAIDFEPISTARAILPPNLKRQWALLDCGANQTVFSVYDSHTLIYSETIPIAGDQFTTILANALKITGAEAEKLKGTALKDAKAKSALEAELEPIAHMVSSAIEYVKSEYQLSPSTVLVSGGSSLIEGFEEWWQAKLSLPVEKARAFTTFPAIIPTEVFYLNALGLALRGIEKQPEKGFSLLPSGKTVPAAPIPPKVKDVKNAEEKTGGKIAAPIETTPETSKPERVELEEPNGSKLGDKKEIQVSLAPVKGLTDEKDKVPDAQAQTRRLKIWLAILMLAVAAFPIAWLFARGDLGLGMDDLSGIIDSTDDEDSTTLRQNVIVALGAEISPTIIDEGQILTSTYTTTETVTATGTRQEDGFATGTATIYNKTTSNKVIIANSRLETAEGDVFKTQSRIEVPHGGTRTVTIKAVEDGVEGNIAPQKLTFVTLPGMTNSLYAMTTETLTGGVQTINFFATTDLTAAQSDIQNTLQEDFTVATWTPALDMSQYTFVPELADISATSSTCAAEQIVTTAENECQFTLSLTAVVINNTWFETESEAALDRALTTEEKDQLYTLTSTTYTITDYDETTGTVTVAIELQYSYS